MNVVSLFCVVILGVVSSLIVREVNAGYSAVICLVTAVLAVLFLLPFIGDAFDVFDGFISKSGLSSSLFTSVIKAIGTGYIAEFVCDMCERCGEKGLSNKIELGEKIYIVTLCIPMIVSVAEWFESICA